MCAIIGWNDLLDDREIEYMISQARRRGRDGWGFWGDDDSKAFVRKNLSGDTNGLLPECRMCRKAVFNFRATPTTELETTFSSLQPFGRVVHNGTIANDKNLGNIEGKVDSTVLPGLLRGKHTAREIADALAQIEGSFAIAYFLPEGHLVLACNYKPIYIKKSNRRIAFASQEYMLYGGEGRALPPYSVSIYFGQDLVERAQLPNQIDNGNKVIVACSSGLDSTTVAFMLDQEGFDVTLAYFKYGCLAEAKELERVHAIADAGPFSLVEIDIPKWIFKGSIVEGDFCKDGNGVAGAEYAKDWVSARNLVLLSLLTAYAESHGIGSIAMGNNLEESGAYPDNEEEFGNRFNALLPFATQRNVRIRLLQPLATYMKYEIVKIGLDIGVPYHLTWSCYSNGKGPCNTCGPCYMRRVAFERNGKTDPLISGEWHTYSKKEAG